MASIIKEIGESFRNNDIIIKLIYTNTAFFFLMRLMDLAALSGYEQPGWSISIFGMPIGRELLMRPWTVMTNIFAHYDFIHFIFNMLCLYAFGRLFLTVYSSWRRALTTYFVGGLAGCAASFLTLAIVDSQVCVILLGASACIMSLMVAASAADPNRSIWLTFIGRVKMKYIAIIYIIISVMMLLALNNIGGNLAHLGGALSGWILYRIWRNQKTRNPFVHRHRMKVIRGSDNIDWDYNAVRAERAREVDHILDKISRDGYNSLTDKEKRVLFDASGKKN